MEEPHDRALLCRLVARSPVLEPVSPIPATDRTPTHSGADPLANPVFRPEKYVAGHDEIGPGEAKAWAEEQHDPHPSAPRAGNADAAAVRIGTHSLNDADRVSRGPLIHGQPGAGPTRRFLRLAKKPGRYTCCHASFARGAEIVFR
jgi:hypothetical protein